MEPPLWARQMMELMFQMGNRASTATQPPAAHTTHLENRRKKPRHSLPRPQDFTNEDNAQYPQFRSFLEAKLRIDAEAIGNEEQRVWYGYGCLSGDAAGRIHPWMQYAESSENFTVKGLLDQLDQAFADPQKQAKALAKINKIHQGNQDFRTFVQNFEQTLLEAQGWGWADEVKKGYLKASINRELRDRLVTQVEPKSYVEYAAHLRMISDNLEELKSWKGNWNHGKGDNNSNSQPAKDTMDWEPTGTVVVATGRTLPGRSPQKRARWVSHEEIGRRMANGDCIRCGNNSHMIRDCSLLPAQKPIQQQQQQTKRRTSSEGHQGPRTIQKPRIASSNLTAAKAEPARNKSTLIGSVIEEADEWESDDGSGKE